MGVFSVVVVVEVVTVIVVGMESGGTYKAPIEGRCARKELGHTSLKQLWWWWWW